MKIKKLIFKIVLPVVAIVLTIIFAPWILLRASLAPLPDTVQEQVNNAVKLGLDGIVVYVDQPPAEPAFYTAGWKDRDKKIKEYLT